MKDSIITKARISPRLGWKSPIHILLKSLTTNTLTAYQSAFCTAMKDVTVHALHPKKIDLQ